MTKKYLDELTYRIIGAAINVHRELGPGLLESVYHRCMKEELDYQRLPFVSHMKVDVTYRAMELETDLRCDLLIEDAIVVELKAVEAMAPIHEAQLMTYMRLLKKPKGILINFTCTNIFKQGQKTIVNELYRNIPDE